jgi:hypothetical protein
MKFTVTCSTADGDETKVFDNWNAAHLYANEWMAGFTHWNHRHFSNVESVEYVNLWKTHKGECVHIKQHFEEHYAEMKEFFIENLKELEFRSYMPFCSCCGSDKPVYIGMIPNTIKTIVSFAFCVNCRDEMMLKKNALTCDV